MKTPDTISREEVAMRSLVNTLQSKTAMGRLAHLETRAVLDRLIEMGLMTAPKPADPNQ